MKKILLFTTLVVLLSSCTTTKSGYTNLVSCMKQNGVVMFGASWCPHCANQKNLFGASKADMPYFECSNGGKQVKECDDRAITSYPTWQFPESVIRSLPESELTKLVSGEVAKIRQNTTAYKEATKDKPEVASAVADFEKSFDEVVASGISPMDKLAQLKTLSQDSTGIITRPTYLSGRLEGEQTLDNIALYSGCSAEYQSDLQTTAKK